MIMIIKDKEFLCLQCPFAVRELSIECKISQAERVLTPEGPQGRILDIDEIVAIV
jgi:hypothetical protein